VLTEVVSNRSEAPAIDELEVSLFGPGYGECVLIHLGLGEWLIIDSCVNQYEGGNPVLDYLKSLGIDPAEAVKYIVASHWDDDHVRGLADILEKCQTAKLVRSLALNNLEFIELVESAGNDPTVVQSGVSEFYRILRILRERKSKGAVTIAPVWAGADRCIWRRPADEQPSAQVWSLSPSDESVTRSLQSIRGLLAQQSGTKKVIKAPRPNHATTVIWVTVGNISVLLGGDLEETGGPNTGWTVIVDSLGRPSGQAEVFKVPHHGSADADQPRVWDEMLVQQPIAVLAPWSRGSHYLPTEADQSRICGRTDEAYLTTKAGRPSRRKRPRTVDKTINETVRRIHNLNGPMGHIQLRRSASDPSAPWMVQLMGAARRMC
jgi:beta-lactamase superfamily II metal-dependent hydrolase